MPFNSARAYASFENIIQRVEVWAGASLPFALNYAQSVIVARVMQRIVEVGLFGYVQLCGKHHDVNLMPACPESGRFACSGLVFNASTGEVKLTWLAMLRALADFCVHWFHVLFVFMLSAIRFSALLNFFKNSATPSYKCKTTLLFGVGKEAFDKPEGDSEFVEFCQQGEIKPLVEAKRIIVQSALKLQSSHAAFSYSRFPLHGLLQANPLGFSASLQFVFQHVRFAVIYLAKTVQSPLTCLLGRDFAYQSMLDSLSSRGLIEAVVITNSNYSAQPLWMRDSPKRAFCVHMVWYSQNTIPVTYKDDMVSAPIPNNRHIAVDEHWLWTEGFATYLKALGVEGRFNVVAPIMWYLPKLNVNLVKSTNEFVITVFDITPVNNEFAEQIGLYRNYYSTENCINFINAIITTCETIKKDTGANIKLLLKHKRAYYPAHDTNYIQLIKQLCESQRITLVEAESNIFNLIAASQLVIVMPYSSPLIIANKLNVPAIYFDASQELLPTYEVAENVYFASNEPELLIAMTHVFNLNSQMK